MLRQDGLTLIEVLIALAIISIALTAVIKAASQNIRGTGYLYDKSLALWTAEEIMSEARLGMTKLGDERTAQTEKFTILDKEYYWRGSETPTGNSHISQLRVRVYGQEPDDDQATPLIDLDGYRYHAN